MITVPREVLEPCAWCKQPAQSILVGAEKRQTISCGNNKCAAFTIVASVEQWNTRVHTLHDVVGAGFSLSRAEQYSAAWQIAENVGYALAAPVPVLPTVPREVLEAFDAFSKACSQRHGPSLIMQQHEPTWAAWKRLCDAFALTAPVPPAEGEREAIADELFAKLCHECFAVPGTTCDCRADILEALDKVALRTQPPAVDAQP